MSKNATLSSTIASCLSPDTAATRARRPQSSLSFTIDKELDWFFTMAESEMGLASIEQLQARHGDDELEDRADAARAHRAIRGWLRAMDHRDAGILQAAYDVRPWPARLRRQLGRLTGIVVRMVCAERGLLAKDHAVLCANERRVADVLETALERGDARPSGKHVEQAEELFRNALKEFATERGRGPSVVRGLE